MRRSGCFGTLLPAAVAKVAYPCQNAPKRDHSHEHKEEWVTRVRTNQAGRRESSRERPASKDIAPPPDGARSGVSGCRGLAGRLRGGGGRRPRNYRLIGAT